MKLGDLIEKITTITGIKYLVSVYTKITGEPCNCEQRKEDLNDISLWD